MRIADQAAADRRRAAEEHAAATDLSPGSGSGSWRATFVIIAVLLGAVRMCGRGRETPRIETPQIHIDPDLTRRMDEIQKRIREGIDELPPAPGGDERPRSDDALLPLDR